MATDTLDQELFQLAERYWRAGDTDTTGKLMAVVGARHPRDATAQHHLGVACRRFKAFALAIDYFHKAIRISPGFHFSELEIGQVHAEMGDLETARVWAEKAIASEPGHEASYLFLAWIHRTRGDPYQASRVLRAGADLHPDSLVLHVQLARELVYLDRRQDAIDVLAPIVDRSNIDQDHILFMHILSDVGRYQDIIDYVDRVEDRLSPTTRLHANLFAGHARMALSRDRDQVLDEAGRQEASARFADTPAVIAALRKALDEGRAFSLIRLGDGEARFLAYFDPETKEMLSTAQVNATLEVVWRNWFDKELGSFDPDDVLEIKKRLEQAIQRADVIGLPLANRLRKDFLHFGYLAFLQDAIGGHIEGRSEIMISDAFVNIEINKLLPFCKELLQGRRHLGIVSPHPGLAARLGAHLGIDSVSNYVVPGEMRLPEETRAHNKEAHFPERFEALLQEIAVPEPGTFFFVAAGLLGKIYCDRIKELGGIAFDIGSVVDAWMDYDTRPGQYDNRAEWVLPVVAAV